MSIATRHEPFRPPLGLAVLLTLAASVAAPAQPANNACANAIDVVAGGAYSGTTVGATNDGSADCGMTQTTADVWYRYTADADGQLSADLCGSNYDTVLSIHTACPASGANQLACNDDSCGTQSAVAALVSAGSTYLIRVSGWNGRTGAFTLHVSFGPPPPPCTTGPDITVSGVNGVFRFGALNGMTAYAVGATSCNIGCEPVEFVELTPAHPVIAQNMYRLMNGRFEQIGQSWVKHAFGSSNNNDCGTCQQPPNGFAQLGVGCADPYGSAQNGTQDILGPRSEINGTTGGFPYPFTAPGYSTLLDRRLQVLTADVTPAQNPGALYFAEVQYIANDDGLADNGLNNCSYRRITIASATATPAVTGASHATSPAIQAWKDNDATVTLIPADYTDPSGVTARFWVGGKATNNGNGTWHYEYAVFNINADRCAGSFRIPVPAGVSVSNIGFHAVPSHSGEPYSNAAWTAGVSGGAITFATESYAANQNANAIRWGTLYNFRFDANAAAVGGAAGIGLFKPGTPASLSASGLLVPGTSLCLGDVNGDHAVDLADLARMLAHFGAVAGATAADGDLNGDGDVDLSDLSTLLAHFGAACP